MWLIVAMLSASQFSSCSLSFLRVGVGGGSDSPSHATGVTAQSQEKYPLCSLFLGLVIAPMLNKIVIIMTVLFSHIRDECSQQNALTTINCTHTVITQIQFIALSFGGTWAVLFHTVLWHVTL